MANIKYTVNQENPANIPGVESISQTDAQLVSQFEINTLFDSSKNYAELHILNLADDLLESDYNYTNYFELGNSQSAGKQGASVLTIDPIEDVKRYGYETGGVKLLYHFLNDLFSGNKTPVNFFIDAISPDRTEVKLKTFELQDDEIVSKVLQIRENLTTQSYFKEFRLNFKNNDLLIGINVDSIQEPTGVSVAIKLYEPLPTDYTKGSTVAITELVSDSVSYEVDSIIEDTPPITQYLRPANFNLETEDDNIIPTQYLNYNELFSYPVSNINSQLYSLVSEKGIELSVNYTDFNNFIHFSSAYERLANFKYKLQLLENYSASLQEVQNATLQSVGTTGSIAYYESLTQGILNNFDSYERYLYYESGSFCWPKSNTTRPYVNKLTTDIDAVSWYVDKLTTANAYDASNQNALVNGIPSFLRDDSNNENYLTFVHMIGQHFDNLWIYTKGVSDKYNADNRLDFGISKDLVAEVLKNFGVKLYTSNKSIEDLFSSFVGQAYQSGSEVINNYITGSVTGSNQSIQPSSLDNYQREVYKRIYHNLPLLLKSKGTERGLRALINCFGIPSDILEIKLYGGRDVNQRPFYGDFTYYTSSLDKIRLDSTGSVVDGNTLPQYTSILKREYKYTDDLHPIEVGFSPTDNVDNYIISKSLSTGSLQSFNIDDYLGDPRNQYLDSYYSLSSTGDIQSNLVELTNTIMSGSDAYNVYDFVRLIKFFDNTIFKMVKDFIPARSTADTGIIIKPHLLQRNKAKGVTTSATQPEYSASIDTAFITGSSGKSFGARDEYDTSYIQTVQTPSGLGERYYHNRQIAKYDGELSGSYIQVCTGELNTQNNYKVDNPVPESRYITLIQDFPGDICVISPTYTPITITSHDARDIAIDFTTLGTSGITFVTGGVDITSQQNAYTFSEVNYTDYIITASNSEIAGCSGSITYTTAYCDLEVAGTSPYAILSGSVVGYDLRDWFISGSNTDTSFTASWESNVVGITTPTNYVFTQPTGSVIITKRDNILIDCTQSLEINIISETYTCTYLESLNRLELEDGPAVVTGSYSYIPCNGGYGGQRVFTSYAFAKNIYSLNINQCIVEDSLIIDAPAFGIFSPGTCT